MEALAARSALAGCRVTLAAPSKPVARKALCVESYHRTRTERNQSRHRRVRNKVSGTTERPRLAVFRSNKHMHCQVIDDTANNGQGATLAAVSTLNKELADLKTGADQAAAEAVGKAIGSLCLEKGIKEVVFDRGGFLYHGRVKAVADGARESGLVF